MKPRLRKIAFSLALGMVACALVPSAKVDAFVLPASPAVVLAEQGPASSSEGELILDVINFILLLAALGYVLRKPARDFFTQRASSIRGKLDEGANALKAAEKKLAEIESKLLGFDEEVARLKAASEKDIEAEHRRIRYETSEQVVRIQQLVQAQIGAAARAVKLELKRAAADEAIEQARSMIATRLDDGARRRLVRSFLAGLHSMPGSN